MKFQPPKGTVDFLPEDATKFQKMIDIIRVVFEKYGFEPLFTPAFESFKLLSAKGGLGEAVKDEIYYFKDKSDRELGLRFDLTMPLARIVASNPQLPKPLKRYVIDKVWRYDEPQAMRWREFFQADIDIIGSKFILADTECLACICEVLDKLGFKDYFIRVNNRKLIESNLIKFIPKEKISEVFKIIDKKDKIGLEGIEKELNSIGINGKKVSDLLLAERLADIPSTEGVKELRELFDYAKIFGIGKKLKLDLSLIRGLEYYTSVVFEVNLGAKVSCGGGGRYDNLIETVGGINLAATGISLGLDRIFEIMKEKKMFDAKKTEVNVFVANVNEDVKRTTIEITQKLRKKNISCQIDLMNRNLTKQLEYADSLGIPYVIVVGPEEVKNKKYKLKDMQKKTESNLKLNEIIKLLSGNRV